MKQRDEVRRKTALKSGQHGAVLVVALIMLLLITAVAVSTISSSTFQTSMTINSQQRQSVLRAAESAAEQPLTDANLVEANKAFLKWFGTKVDTDRLYSVPASKLTPPDDTDTMGMDAVLIYMGKSPAEGFDPKQYKYRTYESRGTAFSPKAAGVNNAQVKTEVVQGAAIIKSDVGCKTYEPC